MIEQIFVQIGDEKIELTGAEKDAFIADRAEVQAQFEAKQEAKQARGVQVKPSQTPGYPAFVWAATWARSQELLYLASWVVQQALGVVAKVLFIGDWLACPSVWHWAPAHHFFDRQAIPALSPRFYANHP